MGFPGIPWDNQTEQIAYSATLLGLSGTPWEQVKTERVEVDFALKRTATNDYERLNRNRADLYQQIYQHRESSI